MLIRGIAVFFILVFSFFGNSQMIMPEVIVDVKFSVEQDGCDATIIGEFNIKEHWHINATSLPDDNFNIPTTFKVHDTKKYKLVGGVVEPKPVEAYDKVLNESLRYHEGKVVFKQKIKVSSQKDFNLSLDFEYQ